MKKIQFHINREDSIQRVRENFSLLYPSLRINFFNNPEKTRSTDPCVMFSPACRIQDINRYCKDGYIEITDGMTVSELENDIRNIFGLHAEISGKIDNRKPMSTQTGNWLLKDNYAGEIYNSLKVHPVYSNYVPFGC
jgi:hypothetical protein